MENTQKSLMLAIIASIASGQSLQAKYREMAQEGYESLKETTRKTKAKAEQAWQNVDKEALKKGALAAGSIAAGTAAAAGAGYAAYSATQTTGIDQANQTKINELKGAVRGRSILDPQNEAVLTDIIGILSSGSFKGNRFKQEAFLEGFNLNQEEIASVMPRVMQAEE